MFVFVAVNAEVFPVTSVGWVIVMVTVFVMNGQLIDVAWCEAAATFGANWAVDSERLCAIVFVLLNITSHLPDDGLGLPGAGKRYISGTSRSHGASPLRHGMPFSLYVRAFTSDPPARSAVSP